MSRLATSEYIGAKRRAYAQADRAKRKRILGDVCEKPFAYDLFIDSEVREAYWIGDYLLNTNGEYKYLFDKGKWYVVGGLYESDGVTPLRGPLPLAKAIEIWLK